MLSNLRQTLTENVALGWAARRLGEGVGIFGVLASVLLALPPAFQDTLLMLLTGRGGELSVTALFSLAVYIFTQWRSYRATVKPQVVTSDGKKMEVPVLTEAQAREITGHTGPIETRNR